jgi:DNA-binding CsgD family transcriptional regulator
MRTNPEAGQPLTPREAEVLSTMARGYTAKEAARELGISPRTVEVHVGNALVKLTARNGLHAALLWDRMSRPYGVALPLPPSLSDQDRDDLNVGAMVFRVPPYHRSEQSKRIAALLDRIALSGVTGTPGGQSNG